MEMTWDLEVLYKGYDDPKYIADCNKLHELIEQIKEQKLDEEKVKETIETNLNFELETSKILSELFSYSNLRISTNVNDYEALGQMGKLRMKLQETVAADVAFTKYLKDKDLEKLATESVVIKEHLYKLQRNQQSAMHMLSDAEEILASKLQMVGSNGWSQLQGNLTSNLNIYF